MYLGTEDTGTKTLKEILLPQNDSETLGQKPKRPERQTAEEIVTEVLSLAKRK